MLLVAYLMRKWPKKKKNSCLSHYICPSILWWAFDYDSAKQQWKQSYYHPIEIPDLSKRGLSQRAVVLIDEIDKAQLELPNGLLETLGHGSFRVPYKNSTVGGNTITNE